MLLPDHFEKFLANISLNSTRRARIESALSNFNKLCREDGPISDACIDSFQQGSFAHGTVVKPLDGEYDVDVIIVLDFSKLRLGSKRPATVISWLATRIREYYGAMPYLESPPRIVQRKRCVRIDYSGDFHLDVVPTKHDRTIFGEFDLSHLLVPDKDQQSWIQSNPKGLNKWITTISAKTEGRFSKVVKMVKHWRNSKFDQAKAPKSIVLETLIGNDPIELSNSLDLLFSKTLEKTSHSLNGSLTPYFFKLTNPSHKWEDLASKWTAGDIMLFRSRIGTALKRANEAMQSRDRSKSVALWKEVFGDSFPEKI